MTEPASDAPPFRILPRLTDLNRAFWTGGAEGELRFLRCNGCGYYNHPPTPICPICHGKDLAPHTVSGKATLHTYTVNHQPWMPGPELPYVVAIVKLPEQEGLRLTTNLVGAELDEIEIGMPLRVVFERHDDGDDAIYLPLFEPDPDR
ncbi:MAG: Zn-ribbon domain-containing OB-fold protein [Actinobacteria bacterium]|nr:Zn-ribbon domain-containing OB-fold protein [Actinomycetota bacterium]